MSRKLLHYLVISLLIVIFLSVIYGCYNNKCYSNPFAYFMNNDFAQIDTPAPDIVSLNQPTLPSTFVKIMFISDSHMNRQIFNSLRNSIQSLSPNFLIHSGDLTNFGSKDELNAVKGDLDSLGIKYFAIPGDHDIAHTSSEENFNEFFSTPIKVNYKGVNFLFIKNGFNFTPLSQDYYSNILSEIPNSDVIILSQPIYVPEDNIFSTKYMGSKFAFENLTETQELNLKVINSQRLGILNRIRESKNNKIIISGDHHRSATYPDPVNNNVLYHVLGSLSEFIYFGDTKISQNSLQSNRYSILEIYQTEFLEGFKFKIREIEL